MNREALTRVMLARSLGMSPADIANLYDKLKQEIEAAADDWRADRANCSDGSVAFLGKIHILVIHADGIFIGKMGELFVYHGVQMTPNGAVFPPPNLRAATRRLA